MADDLFSTPASEQATAPAEGFATPPEERLAEPAFKTPGSEALYDANGTPSNDQLRTIFDAQKKQGLLSKAGDVAAGMGKGLWQSAASVPGAAWEAVTAPSIADPSTWPATGEHLKAAWQRAKEGDLGSAVGEVAQIPQVNSAQKTLSSVLEGASSGAAGLAQMVYKPLKYLAHDLPKNAMDPAGEFDRWKADYLYKLALSKQSVSQSAQEALGASPSDTVAPNPHQAEVVALATQLPAFEAGAAGLGAVRNLAKGAPALVGEAGQGMLGKTLPKSSLTQAIAPGANAEAAALTKAMSEPVEAAEAGQAVPSIAPGIGSRVAAGAGQVASKVGAGMKAVGGAPEQFAQWLVGKATGSPALAEKLGGAAHMAENLAVPLAFVGGGGLIKAIAAVRGLEAAGSVTKGIGDLMTRLAEADPASPFGRLASLAADTSAPEWMQQLAKSPAIRLAITSGRLGASGLKGYAKAGAAGGALGLASGDSPEELGGDISGMGLFGALHGIANSGHAKVFEANLGNVARYVTDSLNAGVSPETLRKVSADQILNAATWEKLTPGWKVRFATSGESALPGNPFVKGQVAEGQAGFTDKSANKTLWVDPTKRDASRTLLHEAFHPIFETLLSQQPEIKASLDRALASDGKTVDDLKASYSKAAYPADAQKAAEYSKSQDQANPDWAYQELLSETAQHHLNGQNLVNAAQGGNAAPTATDIALRTAEGWMKGNGVSFKLSPTGTVLPGFDNTIATPELRGLTHRLLRAQREHALGMSEKEAGTPLTSQDMGTAKAPFYPAPDGRLVNPYGTLVDDGKGGQKFKAFPPSEVRRRLVTEQKALDKYFPKGEKVGTPPAAFWDDPDVNPWTKASLRTLLDSSASGKSLEGWYHRLNKENSATSNRSWAADVARSAGNVAVSLQSGFPVGVRRSKEGNLLVDWASMEAARQKAQAWARKQGPASLEMWGGDSAKFFQDSQTYLKNHSDGQPGESNGVGQQKRDVLNAFWFGDNKEFQAKNPLRAGLRKADRQGVYRSLRADRMETMQPQESEFSRPDWEKGKMNFSPSADPRAVKAAAIMDERGDIYEGPYHAAAGEKYWETKFPGDPTNALRAWTLTPNLVDGFTTNTIDPTTGKPEFLTREEAYQRAQELGQYKAKPGDDGQLESTRFSHQQQMQAAGYAPDAQFSPGAGPKIEIEGPDGKKYTASHDGTQDFSVLGLGHMAQITPLEDLPGGPQAKSTAYAKSLQEKGYKLPDHLTWTAPEAVGQSIVNQAAQEHKLFSPRNVIDNKAPDVKNKGVKELPHAVGDETLRLVHLSSQPGLKVADPKFFGKGRANNNDQRGGPKTYWFLEGSPMAGDENIFGQGGYHAYTADISGKKIYDLRADKEDPLNYYSNPNKWEADTELQKAGYDGVMVETSDDRRVVMLYKSQKVKPAGEFKGGVAKPLADRNTSGLANKDFFSQVTKGTFGKSETPYEPVLPNTTPGQKAFSKEYAKHTGNFDEHIAKSIPGFRESQIRTGAGIAKTYGEGAEMLDIGASEGSYGKTISALSKGKVKTTSLDPNPDMANFFETKSQVPGATYDKSAFLSGFEDNGELVPAYNPTKRFDVAHESMAFQFISPDRAAQIAEVKRLLKPDGVFLTEQKLKNDAWAANEEKKDTGHKAKYFSKAELAEKDKVVGFSQSKHESKQVSMVSNMATDKDLEAVLSKNFKHVVQYWDSGNFRGYAAGDDLAKLTKLVRNIGDLNTDYSTVKTPRQVTEGRQFSPAAAEDDKAQGGFVSQLSKVVDAKFSGKEMPAAQLAAILRNPQNGIKADEMKWTGLDDFLKGKQRVSKAEVQDYLAANRVEVKEVTHGGGPGPMLDGEVSDLTYAFEGYDYVGEVSEHGENDSKPLVTVWKKGADIYLGDAHGDPISGEESFDSLDAAKRRAVELAEDYHKENLKDSGDTKFSDYQLPGGENYREVLFTLPAKSQTMQELAQSMFGRHIENLSVAEKSALQAARNETPSQDFRSGHWDEPNVLAHTRINDRADAAGKPGLFCEEIQSDWHQKGRREGYSERNPKPWTIEGEGNKWRVKTPTGEFLTDGGDVLVYPDVALAQREADLMTSRQSRRQDYDKGVPDAPFKTTWHEMAFRRLVQMAAEQGKDWLGWTTGEQQAERYDLSKQVESIKGYRNEDGTYWLKASRKGYGEGDDYIAKQDLSEQDLADHIGKDAADKLLAKIEENEHLPAGKVKKAFVRLSGLDLKVGGEGMKGFYDKMLVDYANKFGKKFGAKVEDREIPGGAAAKEYPWALMRTDGEVYDVYRTAPEARKEAVRLSSVDKTLEGMEVVPNDEGGKTVHSLTITPEMKASVKQGVQLFSPAAEPSGAPKLHQGLLGGGEAPDMPAIEHMTAQEIADHWPESVVPKVRDEKLGFDIADSPLAKQAGSEPAAVSAYADKIVTTAKEFEANPIYQSGLKWYSEFVPLLKKEFGKHAETMGHLLAALSPRTNPTVNFAFALDALEMYKRGHFDAKLKKYAQGVRMLENGTLERWYKARDTKGLVKDAPQKAGPGTWLAEWADSHALWPRQSNGQLYGTRSQAVLDVLAGRWLEQNEGPKVKNFVQNLLGTGHEATIDVWAARLMRRLGYEGLKPRWRLLPKNETGVSDVDFHFSQKAFRQAAEKLGVSPDALQGGLWFAEKKHWADKGWAPLDLGDYRKEMKKVDLLRTGINQRLATTKAAGRAKPVEQGALGPD